MNLRSVSITNNCSPVGVAARDFLELLLEINRRLTFNLGLS